MSNPHDPTQINLESLEPRLLLSAPEMLSLDLSAPQIDENGSVTLTGTFVDADATDTHFATVDWGDGSSVQTIFFPTGDRSFQATHQYLDDVPTGTASDVLTINASVSDGTDSVAATIDVTIDNVAPTITAVDVDPSAIDEGGTVSLSGSFEDPGTLDVHTVSIDWGDGGTDVLPLAVGERTFSADHQYLDQPDGVASGDFQVSVTVADDDLGSDQTAVAVTVSNVAPSITDLSVDPAIIPAGGTVSLTGSFEDPGALDVHTVSIDWGDGGTDVLPLTVGERTFSADHQYLTAPGGGPQGDYTISVTVTDDEGASDPADATVTVGNIAPSITSVSLDFSAIDEGGTVTLTGTFDDPGALDEHTVTIDWGDGGSDTQTLVVGERTFSASHQYLDEPDGAPSGDFQISVTVADNLGGSDQTTVAVTVSNVAPEIVGLSLDSLVIQEGGTVTLTGSFTDPGTLDEHTVSVDWGDGGSDTQTLVVGERTFSASHQYLDDDPTDTPSDDYVISVTVTDDDGASDTDQTTVTVENVPPEIVEISSSAPGVGDAAEGEEVTVSGSFTDVGILDTHTAVIDWGDGTSSSATIDEMDGSGTFSGSHAYEYGGVYTVTVTLTDDDGGEDQAETVAVISGAGVHDGVLQIVGTRGDDNAKVNQQGNGLTKVHANFLSAGEPHRSFESGQIERIEILLGDGDDHAQLSGNIDLLALVDGGAGDDHIKAGRGPSVLLGEEGEDCLIGGKGNNILIGGAGADRLVGGPGDDILIGGTTAFDINDDALPADFADPLLALLAEWDSGRSFAERKANLEGTGSGPRLNDDYFLQEGLTVFDDGEANRLTGSSGENWLIGGTAKGKSLAWQLRQQAREERQEARALERQLRLEEREARKAAKDEQNQDDEAEDNDPGQGNGNGQGNDGNNGNGQNGNQGNNGNNGNGNGNGNGQNGNHGQGQ